jgi:hypothetical protein
MREEALVILLAPGMVSTTRLCGGDSVERFRDGAGLKVPGSHHDCRCVWTNSDITKLGIVKACIVLRKDEGFLLTCQLTPWGESGESGAAVHLPT